MAKSTSFKPKTWKDSKVEFPSRRQLQNVATGDVTVVQVAKSPGTIIEGGDEWGADVMNALETRIDDAFAIVDSKLTDSLAQDIKKAEGYAVGTQDGTPVTSGTYFQNNSKYYCEQSQSIKNDVDLKYNSINLTAESISAQSSSIASLYQSVSEINSTVSENATNANSAASRAESAASAATSFASTAEYWAEQAQSHVPQGYDELVDTVAKLNNNSKVVMATCTTASAEQIKVINIPSNITLQNNDLLSIQFTNSNTYSASATNHIYFSINGENYEPFATSAYVQSTGAYTTLYGIAKYNTTYIVDVTNKRLLLHSKALDNNTTYTNAVLGQGYATCTTAESTVAKVATLSSYTLALGGIVVVKFTNGVPSNATLNVNSKGAKAIFYKNTAITSGVISAGDLATFIYDGTRYHLISLDSGVGGGGDTGIELTQAEYDALPDTKYSNNVNYYITDAEDANTLVKLTQAEYDDLPDSKYTDGNLYIITDADELTAESLPYSSTQSVKDKIDEVNKATIYSSDEIRIGTLYGKALYRKTFSFTNIGTGIVGTISGITIPITMYGMVKLSTRNYYLPLSYYTTSDNTYCFIQDENVLLYNSEYSAISGTCIVEYLKD